MFDLPGSADLVRTVAEALPYGVDLRGGGRCGRRCAGAAVRAAAASQRGAAVGWATPPGGVDDAGGPVGLPAGAPAGVPNGGERVHLSQCALRVGVETHCGRVGRLELADKTG